MKQNKLTKQPSKTPIKPTKYINPCSFTQLFCPEHVMPYLNSHLKISEYDWKIIKI